jgi:N-acetylglucosaminyldiphosphoundecaprenol N-acetyl-beta-D-mannosaminyltransferase
VRKLLIVLGVPIDNLNMAETLDRLDQLILSGRATGRSHQVATVNADFVVNSLHDAELRRILQESDLATADGTPLVWGARLLGVPLEGRVTGADLVPALAERAAARGYTVFLLGGRPGAAERTALTFREQHPTLRIVGVNSPPNRSHLETDQALLEEIRAAKPDILLVAFGNPKQEKWISLYSADLGVPVSIGVGGTFDMIAGLTRRAPRWMQQIGLEWCYRLAQEPGRLWKRYVHDFVYFGYFFARQWWALRQRGEPLARFETVAELVDERASVLRIRGRLDTSTLTEVVMQAERMLAANPVLVVDLAETTFLDSSAMGALVNLAKQARAVGGALRLAAVPAPVMQVLALIRLDQFFEIYAEVPAALAEQHAPITALSSAQDYIGWTVVKTPRILDAGAAPTLLERCTQHLMEHPRLILDLSETIFLASAGMAAIVKLYRLARERGGELRVAGCTRDVLQGIRLVRLDTVVPLFQDVPTAAA